ncbi:MAG: ASCH domain-containing protein [Candidatus Altiarchaeota archaeon]|nr:ASCH domain-containing protein [Candidatus Altiarchaeota archaeon]
MLHKGPLTNILLGKKTIESRFTKNKCLPHTKIKVDDIILLKESSGPIRGKVQVSKVLFFSNLNPKKVNTLFSQYPQIKADPNFVLKKGDSKFATLIFLKKVQPLKKPIYINKKDRRAWVILDSPTQQSLGLSSLS